MLFKKKPEDLISEQVDLRSGHGIVCVNSLEFDGAMSGEKKKEKKTRANMQFLPKISMAIICSDPFRFDRKYCWCSGSPYLGEQCRPLPLYCLRQFLNMRLTKFY